MKPKESEKGRKSELSGLENIGKVTERWLNGIGVYDEGELRRMGAVKAYRLIRATEAGAGLNLLYALQGAISGTPWNDLAPPIKEMLRRQAERDESGGGRRG
ncbi:MAG: TfoX/Sxy family protein [Acidobacteria bacterium]|nr:TfoX/Sxy family protein [Acidobacteriota bacterium]